MMWSLIASVVVAMVGATLVISRRSRVRVTPRTRNHRFSSETTGVPREISDYDVPRRFARGSIPPPSVAGVVFGELELRPARPALRLTTPSPMDERWDLSDKS